VTDARQARLNEEREKWLSVEEAAHVLRTSVKVIYRMVHNQALPCRREGKVIRIHLDDLRPTSSGKVALYAADHQDRGSSFPEIACPPHAARRL
jgi:excisionase family DNA binding protein